MARALTHPRPHSKVVIFSKTTCPYCTKAKRAFASIGVSAPHVIELDTRADCDAVQAELKKLTGASSVPRVYVGGVFLGGGDDTAAAAANGTLTSLCAKAGAL